MNESLLLEVIGSYFEDFTIMPLEESSVALVLDHYFPYDNCDMDAYYLISNALYHKTQDLVDSLNLRGIRARQNTVIPYVPLAYKTGLAYCIGKNRLSYNEKYGSRICYSAIEIEGRFKFFHENKFNIGCNNCDKCIKACPTGALKKDGIDSDKCLRKYMDNPIAVSDEIAQIMGSRFLGCQQCQNACPMNNSIKKILAPQEINKLIENVLFTTDFSAYKRLLGANLARKKILYNMAIIRAGNMHDVKKLDKIVELGKLNQFESNAVRAIKKISDK